MRRAPVLTEVLDDAEELTARLTAPWVGVLWLTSLPLRLAQIHFIDRMVALGDTVADYGGHVRDLALLTTAALLLALLGRAVYARACVLGLRSGARPGTETLRVGVGPLLSYVCVGLTIELLFVASAVTVLAAPVFLILGGLAAATSPLQQRAALFDPWVRLGTGLRHPLLLIGFTGVFLVAWVVAYVNLYFLFQVGLWLAGALPAFDAGLWSELAGFRNRSFHLLLGAGAWLAVEPFWLATLVVLVQMSLARTTGEDLRITWQRLRARAAEAR